MNERRNWLISVVSAAMTVVAGGLIRAASWLNPPEPKKKWSPLAIYRFPGGQRINWDEQKNGDLIVHVATEGDSLVAIEVWRVVKEGPVFREVGGCPGGYRALYMQDTYCLLPGFAPERHVEQLEVALMLKDMLRAPSANPWAIFGGPGVTPEQQKEALAKLVEGTDWKIG